MRSATFCTSVAVVNCPSFGLSCVCDYMRAAHHAGGPHVTGMLSAAATISRESESIDLLLLIPGSFYQTAASPLSPVRTLIASATETRKILPSPMLPVRADLPRLRRRRDKSA